MVHATVVFPARPTPVATVEVALGRSSLYVGQQTTTSATALSAVPDTLPGRAVAWTSTAPAVATIDSAGTVTAVAPGTVQRTAMSEGKTGRSPVLTVMLVPVARVAVRLARDSLLIAESTQASATLFDSTDAPLAVAGRTVV